MTGNHFDRIAEYYDVLHDDVDYPAECNLLERVFSRFLESRTVTILDLGCGTGNHALELASRGYQVTGIDASPGMVRVARKKARGRTKAAFVRADMRRFDLGRRFDAAICMDGAFTHLLTDRGRPGRSGTIRGDRGGVETGFGGRGVAPVPGFREYASPGAIFHNPQSVQDEEPRQG